RRGGATRAVARVCAARERVRGGAHRDAGRVSNEVADALHTSEPIQQHPARDPLRIAHRTFASRLIMGTGGFASLQLLEDSIAASGCELVTVALRRIDP